MSTLPFLLSVADELDNLNSQSYMDDFGLGFHPHRQYYRTPTIQLSLPASTDWMQHERHRYRTHKFVNNSHNNVQEADEDDEQAVEGNDTDRYGPSTSSAAAASHHHHHQHHQHHHHNQQHHHHHNQHQHHHQRQSYANTICKSNLEDDNVDSSVQLYNLSKKCCKNYYRHANEQAVASKQKSSGESGGFRLQSKCMEGSNSSSDESLQKVSSSIEFLTCFLVKKTRASKSSSSALATATVPSSTTASASISEYAGDGTAGSSSKKS